MARRAFHWVRHTSEPVTGIAKQSTGSFATEEQKMCTLCWCVGSEEEKPRRGRDEQA